MFLPLPLSNLIFKIVHAVKIPLIVYKANKGKIRHFEMIKKVVDGFEPKSFDIVYSTYGGLANVLAGKYAKEKLGCKWYKTFEIGLYNQAIGVGFGILPFQKQKSMHTMRPM